MTTAPLLGTTPASAAPTSTSLTQASFTAQQGNFVRSKGVKSCKTTVSRTDIQAHNKLVLGPCPEGSLIMGAGCYGEWRQTDTYLDTVVQTQQGNGAIVTTTASSALVSRDVSNEFCATATDTFNLGFAYVVECEIAGVFPAEL